MIILEDVAQWIGKQGKQRQDTDAARVTGSCYRAYGH